MPNWMTAAQLAARYIVGESRLVSYSQRGNLPSRRTPDGSVWFDEEAVAMFFAPRQGGMVAPLVSTGPHLGVLGASKMGEKPEAYDALPESRAQPISRAIQTQVASSSDALREALGALSGRDGRRRALRLSPARQEANEQAPLAATGTGHRRLRSGLDR